MVFQPASREPSAGKSSCAKLAPETIIRKENSATILDMILPLNESECYLLAAVMSNGYPMTSLLKTPKSLVLEPGWQRLLRALS